MTQEAEPIEIDEELAQKAYGEILLGLWPHLNVLGSPSWEETPIEQSLLLGGITEIIEGVTRRSLAAVQTKDGRNYIGLIALENAEEDGSIVETVLRISSTGDIHIAEYVGGTIRKIQIPPSDGINMSKPILSQIGNESTRNAWTEGKSGTLLLMDPSGTDPYSREGRLVMESIAKHLKTGKFSLDLSKRFVQGLVSYEDARIIKPPYS